MSNGKQPQTEPQPDYVAAFGLDMDPFRDSLEDRFFYADPALMQRLDLLQHLTQFSDQLLYVRGAEGAGKTTLLRQLKLRAAEHWRLCHLDGARLTAPAELYVELSRCFPETHSENTEHFGTDLLHHCLGLQQNGQLAVVLVDAAEQLPQAVLEALLGLGSNPGETLKALRILLFGTPELLPSLQALGLNSPTRPLLHTLDLPAFDEQQSAAYLMYRLAIAGYSGDSPFSSTEVRGMHKAAAGLPGGLNHLARTTLIEQGQRLSTRRQKPKPTPASTPAQQPRPSGTRWFVILASVATLIIAGGFGWLWYLGNSASGPAPVTEQTVALPPPKPLPQAVPTHPTTSAQKEVIDPGATPPLLATRRPEPSASAPEPTAAPEPGGEISPPPSAARDETRKTPAAEQAPMEQTEAEPVIPQAPKREAKPEAAPAPAPRTADDQVSEAEDTSAAEETSASPPEPAAQPPAAEPMWLERQPGDHYTLQLLGARSPDTVETFIDTYGKSVDLHPVLTQLKGADYHIVLTGSYPDRDAAVAQISELPASLQKLKPWPRRFSRIRKGLTNTP